MKKIFVMIFVIAMVVLSGCDTKSMTEGNVTPDLSEAAYEAKAKVTEQRIEVKDDVFWDSADKMAKLFEDTIEDRVYTIVSLQLTYSDGTVVPLDDFYSFRLNYINDVWRARASSELIYALVTSDEVVRAHNEGKTVKISSVILKWKERKRVGDGNKERIISVCDLDNDGGWDYVIHGKLFFTDVATASLESPNGEKLGIGVINTTPATLQPVEKQPESLRELLELAHSE